MTERNDFNMYSKFDDKVPLRKKGERAFRQRKEEFGSEENFQKDISRNKESFRDWVEKMTKELEK
ncbi:hypothetical protein [Ureibacillus manganicus]|uniref:Uncharacterized protein n=1 Tax=Ureibacillus manganicus DSM 26584 TaxID=1384049 RepID=A0A0A3IZS4_9BACL|nr:hypothetical protein [Ureibacillus manganicus]KGR80277.1 hypothetical protein CD29_02680 [Ureibacillus manganicus DSM 26584]